MRRRTGRTTSVDAYRSAGWREEKCAACRGTGLSYAHRAENPMIVTGMERCRSCAGRGGWWRSPGGMRCAYPGGPWIAG